MVRGAAEIPAGGHGDFGAVAGREQPEDVREDAEELAVETDCREATVGQHQREKGEPSLVVADLGVVHAAKAAPSASLVKSATPRSRELEKHRWRNIKSSAQLLDVGFVEATFLMQNFGYDAF